MRRQSLVKVSTEKVFKGSTPFATMLMSGGVLFELNGRVRAVSEPVDAQPSGIAGRGTDGELAVNGHHTLTMILIKTQDPAWVNTEAGIASLQEQDTSSLASFFADGTAEV